MAKILFAAQRSTPMDTGDHLVDYPTDAIGLSRRTLSVSPECVRATDPQAGDSIGTYRGHAAVFGPQAWIGGRSSGFWERMEPSAFTKAIQENDVRFLINHDPSLILGRNKAGTLRLSTGADGLGVNADLPDTSYARDHVVSLTRGDVTQMSFGFQPRDYEWQRAADGKDLLVHRSVELFDVSSVTFPAYAETDGGLRAAAFDLMVRAAKFDEAEVESILRRAFDEGALTMDETRMIVTVYIDDEQGETTPDDEATEMPQAETTAMTAGRMQRTRLARTNSL